MARAPKRRRPDPDIIRQIKQGGRHQWDAQDRGSRAQIRRKIAGTEDFRMRVGFAFEGMPVLMLTEDILLLDPDDEP